MALHIEPASVRKAWSHGTDADADLTHARTRTAEAGAADLDAVTATVRDAADDMRGVLDVVLAVIDEHHTGLEECLALYAATDHRTAGDFDAVDR